MKIVFVSSFYPPHIGGGAEISLATLVQVLKNLGHEVLVICTGPDKGIVEDNIEGVRVLRVGIKNFYWPYFNKDRNKIARLMWHFRDSYNIKMGQLLESILVVEKPDVVSCHVLAGWSVSVWKIIKSCGIPLVQVLHDMYLLCPRSTMYSNSKNCKNRCGQCSILRFRHANLSSTVDGVVGISRFMLNKHESYGYFIDTPIKYVINNTRLYQQVGANRSDIKNRKVKFGFIGTLSKEKGIEWLLDIFVKISKDLPIELLIAGAGRPNYDASLRKNYENSDIKFLGKVNPPDFYKNIDMLIVPSMWEEPLGMVVPEALAHSVPVLASRRGGLPEMISEGKNGYLFDVENPDQLINLISRHAKDPALIDAMRKNSLESALPFIDTINMGLRYLKLYKEVAN